MSFDSSNLMPDGFQVLNLGISSGVAPNTLQNNQASFAINTQFRNGFPENRPGWVKRTLKFLDADGAEDATIKANFEDGLFQGAAPFERRNRLVASVGGRLFSINLDNLTVLDVSISGDLNRSDLRKAWMTEAEDWIIVQDGQASPIFFDGAKSRRSDQSGEGGTKEVPTGTVISYNMGRLVVANSLGNAFIVGDIVFGPSGTSEYERRDSILKVTENDYLNEGGAFGIPLNAGKITAMSPIAQLDTSTGQGPLQVFTDRAVFSLNAPVDRTQWKNVQFPIQSVSAVNSGATGFYSATQVNGDIWFRSQDGIRSLAVGYREFGTWTNKPLSKEVDRILSKDDPNMLDFASAAIYDGNLLVSVSPYRDQDYGTLHKGFAVLDFNPNSAITGIASPIWNGAWTGLNAHQIMSGNFNGVERCFIFARNSDDELEVWELDKRRVFDNDGTNDKRITWWFEPKSFSFEDGGWALKKLEYADIWYDRIQGDVNFTLEYRKDQIECWQDWHTWISCASIESCIEDCMVPQNIKSQNRSRVRTPQPNEDCDETSGKPWRIGYEFQPRITVVGATRIKKFRMFTSPEAEEAMGACTNFA